MLVDRRAATIDVALTERRSSDTGPQRGDYGLQLLLRPLDLDDFPDIKFLVGTAFDLLQR